MTSELTGREANDQCYEPVVSAYFEAIGARMVFEGSASEPTTELNPWEQVAVVEYPCPLAFFAMSNDPGFLEASAHKDAGVEASTILVATLASRGPSGDKPLAIERVQVRRYHPQAIYPAGREEPRRTGEEAMNVYTASVARAEARAGVLPTGRLEVDGWLIGDGREWHDVRIQRLPNEGSLISLLSDPDHLAAEVHLEAAIEESMEVVIRPNVSDLPWPCEEVFPISSAVSPGNPTTTGLYDSVAAAEWADASQTHVYRGDFGGSLLSPEANVVTHRLFESVNTDPYNVVTRNRDEVFLSAGTDPRRATSDGPIVVKFDATSGRKVWSTRLRETKALGELLWPGVVTAHANGDLYAIHGRFLTRLDADRGEVLSELELPTPPMSAPEDAHYNGFTVLASGVIVAKTFTPGCVASNPDDCSNPSDLFTTIVAVDASSMRILAQLDLAGTFNGRISSTVFAGRTLIYLSGDRILRVQFTGDALVLDSGWEVRDFLLPGQTPPSSPMVMGEWLIFQTNAAPSTEEALSVHVVSQADARNHLVSQPHPLGVASGIPSGPAVDPDNLRIYSADALAGTIACLEVVEGVRLETRWIARQTTGHHTSLVGPPHARVFVATDAPEILRGLVDPEARVDEQVVWRDAASGEELARSETLPTQMQIGSPLAPGFFGVWYYLGTNGEIVELSVSDARQVTTCRR